MCRERGQSTASTDPDSGPKRHAGSRPALPLVLAAGVKRGEDAQVRAREEPAFRVASCGSGRADGRTEMLAPGHRSKVLRADACQL